jgi:protein involved in polysaccharide export with SLBB domain
VFVGLSTRLVTLRGAVRRPGVYELRDGEKISRLLEFGGGTLSTAAMDRLLIDRVLPPAERAPGKERALIDVPFNGQTATLDTLNLYDGDVVTIFSVGDVRRNRVALQGEVFEPGMYEWTPNLTLAQLTSKAQGFLPWALTDRIKIERQIPHTGRSELLSVSAQDSSLDKVVLQEFDEVTVLDARRAFPIGTVAISGSVVNPGQRPYAEKMTLKDFIDLSGGFKPEAAVVELARRKLGARYSDTSAVIHTYTIEPGGRLSPDAAGIVLESEDRINVRGFPGFRSDPRTVTLVGLFTYPGVYVLRSDAEKLSDVVRRASGLLPPAYPAGARLIRDGRPVAIDLTKALHGDRENDIYLSQGDRLEVGPDPSVVYVAGAVERQVIVPFHPGWQINDYISAAGGFSDDAERNNIVVEYPSGEIRSKRSRHFLMPDSNLPIISGSTITVGQKAEGKGANTGDVLTRTVQVVSTLMSLLIGYLAVRR